VTAPRFKGIFAGPIDIDRKAANATYPLLPATAGIIVTHRATGQSGIIIEASASAVRLRLPTGGVVMLALRKGAFEVDGRVVTLTRPTGGRPMAPRVTASGSIAANRQKAQVARASRIWVEGVHDAELIEKIWGDDLRSVGIVVEAMNGMDDLVAEVGEFLPSRTRRLGVLLDHLRPGTKEHRIAKGVSDPYVLITGHPFVDVWAAVRPAVAGIGAWPDIPMGTPWKEGICAALGAGHPGAFWRELLGRVDTWTDLDTSLINAVEQLIDFVTLEQ
jgi:hypothetical protein